MLSFVRIAPEIQLCTTGIHRVKILTLEEIPHVLQHKNVTDVALRKGNVHKRYACSITTLWIVEVWRWNGPPRMKVSEHRPISLLYPRLNDSLH